MRSRPLINLLTALVIMLLLGPLLPDTSPFSTGAVCAYSEEEELARMRQVFEDTAAEFGVKPEEIQESYSLVDEEKEPHLFCITEILVDDTPSVQINILIALRISPEWTWDLDLEHYWSQRENAFDRSKLSFHGYPAVSASADYHQLGMGYWFAWECGKYYFTIQTNNNVGCPYPNAQDIAEILFSKVQEQGLLIEPGLENQPPSASFDINPKSPTPDDPVLCVSTSTDPDGDELLCTWYLDGDFADLDSPIELGRLETGKHTITLHVNDGNEGTDECSKTITVSSQASNGGMGCAGTSRSLSSGRFDISPLLLGIVFVSLVLSKCQRRRRK
jgi:hypothetical protein